MSRIHDDELILLWRQGTSTEPNQEEIARLAGSATVKQFDRVIFWRNFLEYAAGAVGVVFLGWLVVKPEKPLDRVQGLTGFLCLEFYIGYLWWQHRSMVPLDASADARTYQAAMLVRIDRQIRVLSTIRYWGLPVYLWLFGSGLVYGNAVGLAAITCLYIAMVWLNERSPLGSPKTTGREIEDRAAIWGVMPRESYRITFVARQRGDCSSPQPVVKPLCRRSASLLRSDRRTEIGPQKRRRV